MQSKKIMKIKKAANEQKQENAKEEERKIKPNGTNRTKPKQEKNKNQHSKEVETIHRMQSYPSPHMPAPAKTLTTHPQ